jgi:hypothetical protein
MKDETMYEMVDRVYGQYRLFSAREQVHRTVTDAEKEGQQAGSEHQTADLDQFGVGGKNVNQQAHDSDEQTEVNDHAN